ncbi:hypothetical protein KIN20_036622 [Parelaphostrongylus tenuis]|uniref:Uncharacterized protein n=1 Tax=Parelaphostrongylus tenuis TaxID=148309 RepID=A0AAD5RD37_PARTN|nr:hypothetical protein KIN20_036622 [Parelaphostrongylus tenuis]
MRSTRGSNPTLEGRCGVPSDNVHSGVDGDEQNGRRRKRQPYVSECDQHGDRTDSRRTCGVRPTTAQR